MEFRRPDLFFNPPSAAPPGPAGTARLEQECRRVGALRRYDILDTPSEDAFDRITALAARIFAVPVVIIGLVDDRRVWFKSRRGIEDREMLRELSLCTRVVEADEICWLPDATADPFWAGHPLVTGPTAMRFYAAAPLRSPEGLVLGTLCLMDQRPRGFSEHDQANLCDLAGTVMDELELRRQARARWRAQTEAADIRYGELFEASPQPMWVYDLETLRFLAVNRAAIRLYGYTREEFLAMTIADIRPAEDVPALLHEVHRPAGADGRLLWRHLRKDGTLIDVEISSNGLTTYGGRPSRLVMAYDVSGRERAQGALAVRDRYLAATVETQRELLRQPTVAAALPTVLARLGEAAGASRSYFFQFYPQPDGRSLVREERYWCAPGVEPPGDFNAEHVFAEDLDPSWIEQLARGEAVQVCRQETAGLECKLLDLCGARAILLSPVRVEEKLCGSLGFANTRESRGWEAAQVGHLLVAASTLALACERERSAHALAEEKERLAVTLATLDEGVITTDSAGCVVLMNRVAEGLTGWTQTAALGQPLGEVFATFEDAGDAQPRVLASAAAQPLPQAAGPRRVWLAARGSDTRHLVAETSTPLLDREGRPTGAVRVFRDVSAEERLTGELLKASKLDSIGILAGGIAHDFNNILTAVMGNVSLARRLVTDNARVDAKLDEAERACLRARDLTGQLLTFARGGAPIKTLARLPETIRESVDFALHGCPVQSRFDLAEDLWPVEADTGQLSQVLNNLAINAVQAMPMGGCIRVRAENLLLAEHDLPGLRGGRYLKISVEDDGTGIAAEHLEKIFDPFFTTKENGTGLGLATSYSIVKKHGGHLSVDSVPGVGSVFRVHLPAASAAATAKLDEAQRLEPETPPVVLSFRGEHGWRVLVLEDEPSVQELLREMLAHLGYESEITARGEDTVKVFRQAREAKGGRPFDAVILDLTVPGGMGGRETVERLREIDPGVRTVVSSGYSNDPIMSRYAEHGFAGVLSKPYRLDEMAATLAALWR